MRVQDLYFKLNTILKFLLIYNADILKLCMEQPIQALVTHPYSSHEMFTETPFNFWFQCLAGRGIVGVNLRLQEIP